MKLRAHKKRKPRLVVHLNRWWPVGSRYVYLIVSDGNFGVYERFSFYESGRRV